MRQTFPGCCAWLTSGAARRPPRGEEHSSVHPEELTPARRPCGLGFTLRLPPALALAVLQPSRAVEAASIAHVLGGYPLLHVGIPPPRVDVGLVHPVARLPVADRRRVGVVRSGIVRGREETEPDERTVLEPLVPLESLVTTPELTPVF